MAWSTSCEMKEERSCNCKGTPASHILISHNKECEKINSTLKSNTPIVLNRIWSLSKHKINTRLLRRVIKLKYTEIKRQENHRRGSPRIKNFSCIQNLITALTGTNEFQIKTQKEHKGSETIGTVIPFSTPILVIHQTKSKYYSSYSLLALFA